MGYSAYAPTATIQQFIQYPRITFYTDYLTRQLERQLTDRASIDLLHRHFPAVTTTQPELLLDLALVKNYTLVLPVWLASSTSLRNLWEVHLATVDLSLSICLCCRKERELSPAASRMANIFRTEATTVQERLDHAV